MTSGHDNWYQSVDSCANLTMIGYNRWECMAFASQRSSPVDNYNFWEMKRKKEIEEFIRDSSIKAAPPPWEFYHPSSPQSERAYDPYCGCYYCYNYYNPGLGCSPEYSYQPSSPSYHQPIFSDQITLESCSQKTSTELIDQSYESEPSSSRFERNIESWRFMDDDLAVFSKSTFVVVDPQEISSPNESDLDFDANSDIKTPHLDVYDFNDFDVDISFHKEVVMDVIPIILPRQPSRSTLSISANKKLTSILVLSKQYKEIPLESTVIQLNNNSQGPKLEDKFHLKRVGMSCPRKYVNVKLKKRRRIENYAMTA